MCRGNSHAHCRLAVHGLGLMHHCRRQPAENSPPQCGPGEVHLIVEQPAKLGNEVLRLTCVRVHAGCVERVSHLLDCLQLYGSRRQSCFLHRFKVASGTQCRAKCTRMLFKSNTMPAAIASKASENWCFKCDLWPQRAALNAFRARTRKLRFSCQAAACRAARQDHDVGLDMAHT